MPDFITDMPTTHLKSDYWRQKLLKLCVRITSGHNEQEGTTSSTIPKQLHCSYNTNFIPAVIQNAEEAKTAPWHRNSVSIQNAWHWIEQTVIKWGKYNKEEFCILWVKAKNFNANYAEVLECVLRKHKNILFVMGATEWMRHWQKLHPRRFWGKMSKPLVTGL